MAAAALVTAGVLATALAGCSSSGPVTKGGVGTTLDMMTGGVRLKVTVAKVQDIGSGTTVQFNATDTDHSQSADIKDQSFVAEDGSGAWSFPAQATVVNPHQSDDGNNIGPGQTVTGRMTFQAAHVTRILYNGPGFVVDPQGQPVNGGSAYYQGYWTVGN
ncbi:hypothetical protein LN042_33120 [Kitasatospora sp. RB6PN24]|uniref:hypothetical protein n=1 Tax=Kitasatospora humi TaxID=2893891 RepID=UPI001E64B6A8|nr:hypothetical protein [Kitasatospora humi]MCC9311848.1 hypothetical protein [Kitasatospora humi]